MSVVPPIAGQFLVAPWIGLESITCWTLEAPRVALLQKSGLTAADLLRNVLDSLQAPEEGRPVRLGYTLGIGVFDLFSPTADGWAVDPEKLRFYTDLFLAVGRPVVVHLRANHFVGESPLVKELVQDDSSYARTCDGETIRHEYYTNTVFAPTFSRDPAIPFNRFRMTGFRALAEHLAEFDRRHPDLIQAFTLAGELHHLVPNFADPSTAGNFQNVRMTDYSEASVRDFRAWLAGRHETVAQLNARFGTPFASWDEVQPPSLDLNGGAEGPAWMHMDSYADGILPIFGWAELPPGAAVAVYLDGERAGAADYGLSRLDVYDAVERFTESDLGFRFSLDARWLSPGRHAIHVVLELPDGTEQLIGRRTFLLERDRVEWNERKIWRLDRLPPAVNQHGCAGWVDHPAEGVRLLLNPYAAEWQRFREWQVQSLLDDFSRLAIEAGLPREKLYSHHLSPQFEGSWNEVAFALPAQALESEDVRPGVTLYGGASVCRSVPRVTAGRPYGVCELHPRMGRAASRDIYRRALDFHYQAGAAFLCPYYMNVIELTRVAFNAVAEMVIHPLNARAGSLFYYSALVEFLNRDHAHSRAAPAGTP